MQTNIFEATAAPADAQREPTELAEAELNHVAGGLLPAVGPANAKGKCPTAVE